MLSRREAELHNLGGIRINLAGREPSGKVGRDEFDGLCASIRDHLLTFENVDTGAPVVRDVKMTRDLYSGEHFDYLPDMLVFWNHDTPVERIRSEKTGVIEDRYRKGRTGDHTPLGMFFAAGSRVVPGRLDSTVSVVDFGPTIAERTGVTLADVDGRSFAARIFR